MKKIFYILAFFTILTSCEKNVPEHNYHSEASVAFEAKEVIGKESVSEIKIPVIVADAGRSETVTVDFELEAYENDETMLPAMINVDYTLKNESNTLTFEPGVSVQYIIIEPVDDLEPISDKALQVTLTSNSKNYKIGMPGPDNLNSTLIAIIKEDDCPLTEDIFQGKIEAGEDSPWWDDCPGKYEWVVDTVLIPGKKIQYKVSGWFYPQLLTAYSYWYDSESDIEFKPVTLILDVTNPADPRYSLFEEPAFTIPAESWGYDMKAVDNQPVNIDVCGKYVEIPYTLLGSSWVHNYVFTVKFQF